MGSIEQTGKTVEEAIQAALKALGVSREDITVEVLDEPVKGMFGLGTKEARIRVSTKDDKGEAFGGADSEDQQKAKDSFIQVISRMGLAAEVESWEEDGYIHINAEGPDMGIIIGRQGQTLDALQFILNLILNKNREERIRVILDAEFYRERRKKLLANMAEKMAARAMETGQEVVLSAMTPFERRVIHTTLQGNENVVTFSEGEDPYRRVIVRPR